MILSKFFILPLYELMYMFPSANRKIYLCIHFLVLKLSNESIIYSKEPKNLIFQANRFYLYIRLFWVEHDEYTRIKAFLHALRAYIVLS